jgi:hypothetical protein
MDSVLIDRNALPPEEHSAANSIQQNLMTLQANAEEFRQSANLYLFAHTRKLLVHEQDMRQSFEMIAIMKIAGRNGAVVAYSFSRIMEAINCTKAPTIWAKADKTEKQKATKLFAKEFPSINAVRHSAAHPGELMKNADEEARHRLRQPLVHPAVQMGGPSYIESLMHASNDALRFGSTFEGQFREYELSLAKADVLDAVASHYCRTFYPLENQAQAQAAQYLRESEARQRLDQKSRPPWWSNLIRL